MRYRLRTQPGCRHHTAYRYAVDLPYVGIRFSTPPRVVTHLLPVATHRTRYRIGRFDPPRGKTHAPLYYVLPVYAAAVRRVATCVRFGVPLVDALLCRHIADHLHLLGTGVCCRTFCCRALPPPTHYAVPLPLFCGCCCVATFTHAHFAVLAHSPLAPPSPPPPRTPHHTALPLSVCCCRHLPVDVLPGLRLLPVRCYFPTYFLPYGSRRYPTCPTHPTTTKTPHGLLRLCACPAHRAYLPI